jgi:hypothetical protein
MEGDKERQILQGLLYHHRQHYAGSSFQLRLPGIETGK